eukprot:jgi/Astpho2/1283/fgenesh1_pg.00023_%23_33_t
MLHSFGLGQDYLHPGSREGPMKQVERATDGSIPTLSHLRPAIDMRDEPQVTHLGAPCQYLSWCTVEQQENVLLILCGFGARGYARSEGAVAGVRFWLVRPANLQSWGLLCQGATGSWSARLLHSVAGWSVELLGLDPACMRLLHGWAGCSAVVFCWVMYLLHDVAWLALQLGTMGMSRLTSGIQAASRRFPQYIDLAVIDVFLADRMPYRQQVEQHQMVTWRDIKHLQCEIHQLMPPLYSLFLIRRASLQMAGQILGSDTPPLLFPGQWRPTHYLHMFWKPVCLLSVRCASGRLDRLPYSDVLVLLVHTPRVMWFATGPAALVGSLELMYLCVLHTSTSAAAASGDHKSGLCVTLHAGTLASACSCTCYFYADICAAEQCMLTSTAFAEKHSTQTGLECYTMRLLHTYSMLQQDSDAVAHMLEQAQAKTSAT